MVDRPAGDERVRYRGDRIALLDRPVAGPDGVERVETARRSPGVRHLVVDDGALLLLPDGPQGPGDPTWRLPGGPAFDSLPAYEAARDADRVAEAVGEAASELLASAVGLAPVTTERPFVLSAGPGVDAPLHYVVVSAHRAARRQPAEPAEANWVAFDDARAACLDGRVSEARSALAVVRWLATDDGD